MVKEAVAKGLSAPLCPLAELGWTDRAHLHDASPTRSFPVWARRKGPGAATTLALGVESLTKVRTGLLPVLNVFVLYMLRKF